MKKTFYISALIVVVLVATLFASSIFQVYQGGTGRNTLTAHAVLLGEGTTAVSSVTLGAHQVAVGASSADPSAKTVPDCQDSGGNHINFTQSTDAFSCGTSSSGGGGGGSGDYSTAPSNLPTASGMTWVNQGTSTATQTAANGPVLLALADSGSLNWRYLAQSAPGTPYKLIVMLRGATTPSLHNSQTIGIYFRSTGSGKLLGIECLLQTGGWVTRVERLNSVTSDNSTQATLSGQSSANNFAPILAPFWYQLRNDGTTLYADWSFDGKNFTNLWSEAVGAFVSPDQIGVGGVSVTSGANANVLNYVLQFQTFNNATL